MSNPFEGPNPSDESNPFLGADPSEGSNPFLEPNPSEGGPSPSEGGPNPFTVSAVFRLLIRLHTLSLRSSIVGPIRPSSHRICRRMYLILFFQSSFLLLERSGEI